MIAFSRSRLKLSDRAEKIRAGTSVAGAKSVVGDPMIKSMALLITAASLLAVSNGSAPAESSGADAYITRLLAANAAAVRDLDLYTRSAEAAADSLAPTSDGAGAKLWLAGDRGFVLEGYNRAGGLMMAQRLKTVDEISAGDVVLAGSLFGDDAETASLLTQIADCGALTILFAPRPASSTTADHLFISVHADAPDKSDLPTASPALAQSLWTFTGELVSSLMRDHGRTPTIFRSVLVPGGREYNEQFRGHLWLEGSPQHVYPRGLLGRRYLACMANMMRTLRATQSEKFARAGVMSRETIDRGGTVWLSLVGHLPPSQPEQVPEDQMPFTLLPGQQPDRVPDLVKPGDLVLYVGYYEPMGPWVDAVHEADARIVTVVSGTPERSAGEMGADINIRGCWPYGDVTVGTRPFVQTRDMLPPSGVIQSAAFWLFLAEIQRSAR